MVLSFNVLYDQVETKGCVFHVRYHNGDITITFIRIDDARVEEEDNDECIGFSIKMQFFEQMRGIVYCTKLMTRLNGLMV